MQIHLPADYTGTSEKEFFRPSGVAQAHRIQLRAPPFVQSGWRQGLTSSVPGFGERPENDTLENTGHHLHLCV